MYPFYTPFFLNPPKQLKKRKILASLLFEVLVVAVSLLKWRTNNIREYY